MPGMREFQVASIAKWIGIPGEKDEKRIDRAIYGGPTGEPGFASKMTGSRSGPSSKGPMPSSPKRST